MHHSKIILATLIFSQGLFAQVISFGGNDIPKAVQDFMIEAKNNGALFYDVNEPGKDGEPKYNPHISTSQDTGSMTFSLTEITPEVLQKDIDSKESNTILSGYISSGPVQQAEYKEFVGGTGNVIGHYDEATHSDMFARGMQGQKWANNCGFLEDGTLHCLPAMRRSESSDYILVNPDLSRGKLMVYNGHLDIRAGVVESIELSGRLSKLIAKGRIKMIDPVALLKVWGFKVSPHVQLIFGNTGDGIPVIDAKTGLLVSAKPPKP